MFKFTAFVFLSLLLSLAFPVAAVNAENAPDLEETQISDYGRNEFSGIIQEDTSNQGIHNRRTQPAEMEDENNTGYEKKKLITAGAHTAAAAPAHGKISATG